MRISFRDKHGIRSVVKCDSSLCKTLRDISLVLSDRYLGRLSTRMQVRCVLKFAV